MIALVKSENFVERAEHIMPYQEDNTTQVRTAITEITNKAGELLQASVNCIPAVSFSELGTLSP